MFKSMLRDILCLKTDRRGVTALEYGLIAGVLVLAVLVGFQTLGGAMSNEFENVANYLNVE